MLVLSRSTGETITICLRQLEPLIKSDPDKLRRILSDNIIITVCRTEAQRARLGFDAAREVSIIRSELR